MHDKSIEQEKALSRILACKAHSTYHFQQLFWLLLNASVGQSLQESLKQPNPTLSLKTCFTPAVSSLLCFQGDPNKWVNYQAQQCHIQRWEAMLPSPYSTNMQAGILISFFFFSPSFFSQKLYCLSLLPVWVVGDPGEMVDLSSLCG